MWNNSMEYVIFLLVLWCHSIERHKCEHVLCLWFLQFFSSCCLFCFYFFYSAWNVASFWFDSRLISATIGWHRNQYNALLRTHEMIWIHKTHRQYDIKIFVDLDNHKQWNVRMNSDPMKKKHVNVIVYGKCHTIAYSLDFFLFYVYWYTQKRRSTAPIHIEHKQKLD